MTLLLVRYNELGLKSPKVRRRFQRKLVENIEKQFMEQKIECLIDSLWGRILVHTSEVEKGVEIITRIFGISSVSITEHGTGVLQEIIEAVLDYAEPRLKSGQTFAIRARRYGNHDFTSIELAEKLGSALLDEYGERKIKVKLKEPDVELFVEVRNNDFYLFSDKKQGVGGLPLGTQGRIMGVYENPRSFIAWWLMMKRGATVIPVLPMSEPKGDENGPNEQLDDEFKRSFEVMRTWSPELKLRFYEERKDEVEEGETNSGALHKLYRIMDDLGEIYRAEAVVSGMSMDEFKDEMGTAHKKNFSVHPLFVPLIGLEDNELADLERLIFG